jgi:hypothetical protein
MVEFDRFKAMDQIIALDLFLVMDIAMDQLIYMNLSYKEP